MKVSTDDAVLIPTQLIVIIATVILMMISTNASKIIAFKIAQRRTKTIVGP